MQGDVFSDPDSTAAAALSYSLSYVENVNMRVCICECVCDSLAEADMLKHLMSTVCGDMPRELCECVLFL